jgi:hypothetical protein
MSEAARRSDMGTPSPKMCNRVYTLDKGSIDVAAATVSPQRFEDLSFRRIEVLKEKRMNCQDLSRKAVGARRIVMPSENSHHLFILRSFLEPLNRKYRFPMHRKCRDETGKLRGIVDNDGTVAAEPPVTGGAYGFHLQIIMKEVCEPFP